MDAKKININGLYVEITDKCNFNCIYCYNDSTAKKLNSLSIEAYKDFIEIVKEYGLERITLSGGEPTLHPKLAEILNINHVFGLEQRLITNGTRITENLLNEMVSKDLTFQLTIDGHDEASNDLMRGKNAYAITTNAIKMFIANGFSDRITVRCNLHFGNYEHMYTIVTQLKEMGIRKVGFALISNLGRATDIEIIDVVKHARIIKAIEDNVATISRDIGIIPDFSAEPTMACPYESPGNSLTLRIDSQGNIYPCQIINDSRFSLGNIHLTSAISLKNNISDFSAYVLSRQSKISKCRRCVYKAVCHGGCIASSLEYSGNPLGVDGQCSIRKKNIKQMLLSKGKSA